MPNIQTSRLLLREFSVDDADFIIELLNSPGWLKYIGDRGIKTIPDAKSYLLNGPINSYKVNGFGLYLVKLKSEDKPIGMCGLIKRDQLPGIDIGFAFLPAYERQGYGYEAATATMDYGRKELGLASIYAITIEENTGSIELLKKLGLEFEQKIRLTPGAEELLLFKTIES